MGQMMYDVQSAPQEEKDALWTAWLAQRTKAADAMMTQEGLELEMTDFNSCMVKHWAKVDLDCSALARQYFMMKDCCLGDEEKPPQPPSGEQALNLGFRSLKEYATLPNLEGVDMD